MTIISNNQIQQAIIEFANNWSQSNLRPNCLKSSIFINAARPVARPLVF
jgi:hypothetical protein